MMRELPTGTVTFLFTDIEGSTKILEEQGEAYATLLQEHRRVLRDCCGRNRGVEVDTQGDAFFVAFSRATDAVCAAAEAQEALELPVRMGIHTGEPTVTDDGYVGIEVHRGARICGVAHGGQVVVSGATKRLLGTQNVLRDLGNHRLKDLARPIRLYQLGEHEFPPLRSLYRTNLPVPATPFLGRKEELRVVAQLLSRQDVHLLTLTGAGGTGKTRLALQAAAEVADRFPDGIWWVPLAPMRDPQAVLPAVAQVLGLAPSSALLEETLRVALRGRQTLILLDNAEHLLPDFAERVAAIAPDSRAVLLVTSRERLQVRAEHVYAVPQLCDSDGVELFISRACAVGDRPSKSPALAKLCTRLDNLALALELAAARAPVFTPEQLLERLSQRLDLLKGVRDADPRQQTLRATIDWSYELLDDEEQRLFRSLAVFVGGCTYEAAEELCGAAPDTLQSLLDKSLLRIRDVEQGRRYWMLETIRQYAAESLAHAGDSEDLRRRHAQWAAQFAIEAGERLDKGINRETLEWIDAEYGNIAAALAYAAPHDPVLTATLAASIARWWDLRGRAGELEQWIGPLLDRDLPLPVRAQVLVASIGSAMHRNDVPRLNSLGEELLEVASILDSGSLRARALIGLGSAAFKSGDAERGETLEREAIELARTAAPALLPVYLGNLGWLLRGAGKFDEARPLLEEAVVLARRNPTHALPIILAQSANLALDERRFREALELYREAIERIHEWRMRGIMFAVCLSGAAASLLELGRPEDAARLEAAAERLAKEFGVWNEAWRTYEHAERFRDEFGDERYAELAAEGAAMNPDDAAACALTTAAVCLGAVATSQP